MEKIKIKKSESLVWKEMEKIPETWCFLFVGHWLAGEFGEDRKNVSGLIRTFLETYKNKSAHNQPALILKTSSSDFSPLDKEEVLRKIKAITDSVASNRLPNIYLLHGDLTDEEMNSLYNHPKVKAHITFTKGEGYGRPLAEAGMSQKPIIATNWSGHIDFLTHAVLLPGTLTNVHPSAAWQDVLLQESQWMTVDYAYASATMRYMTEDYKQFADLGKAQCTNIKKNFSLDAMHDKLVEILDRNVPKFPQQVALKLPQLKKIELPKLTQIKTEQ